MKTKPSKRLKHTLVRALAVLLIAVVAYGCKPETALRLSETSEQTTNALNETLPDLMRRNSVAGMSLTLIRGGEIVAISAFGLADDATGQHIKPDTVFEVASLGKPVFAYLAIGLARDGMLDLDAPLVRYVPDIFSSPDRRLQSITARMILSHSSGLPNFETTSSEELLFDPGTGYAYSGVGFEKLQRVVEAVTGKPLNALAQEKIFDPFDMASTSYAWREDFGARFAFGHDENGKQLAQSRLPQSAHAAWSLYSTAEDYAQFVARLLDLNDPIASEMFTAQIAITDQISWGHGWSLQATAPNWSFWHWGSNPGYRSYVVGYPVEGIAVVVLSNSDSMFKLIEDTIDMTIGGQLPSFSWF